MKLQEIYADRDGRTRFREIDLDLRELAFAPPSEPVQVTPELAATTARFLLVGLGEETLQ